MARRYVPKTYNNRRILRIFTSGIIAIGLAVIIIFIILFFVFQNHVVNGQLIIPWLDDFQPTPAVLPVLSEPAAEPEPDGEPEEELPPAEDPLHAAGAGSADDEADEPGRIGEYTLEQIQSALEAQFARNAFGERNPQVISAEQVERDRDSITLESAGPDALPIDLSNSKRYKVEYRFEQPIEEFRIWEEPYSEEDEKPFRRDGNHTILTDYFYFNDLNGVPALAFIRD